MNAQKIFKELRNQVSTETENMLVLFYDKKDPKAFLDNCFSYISRELDSTMIVKSVSKLEIKFEEFPEIFFVINNKMAYNFKAKSKMLDYIESNNKSSKKSNKIR